MLNAYTQESSKLADSIAASEEHVEELKGRITARQDWIAREQESVDAKIEEATRPVTAQRTTAAEEHSALDEEVQELRWVSSHIGNCTDLICIMSSACCHYRIMVVYLE